MYCSPMLIWETPWKNSRYFEWHKLFNFGRDYVEDVERSGRWRCHRTDKNDEKVWNLVHTDRRLSIRAVAVKLNVDKETVKCVEIGLNFGPALEIFSVTKLQLTRHSLSTRIWNKNRLLEWNAHPVPLTSLRMTCACFQK